MIGEIIRKLRKGALLSVKDVADRIGVSEQALYQWEAGKRKIPNAYVALILLQILDADQIAPVIDKAENIGKGEKTVIMKIVRWVSGLPRNEEND